MALPSTIDFGDLDKAMKSIGLTGNPSLTGFRLTNDQDGRYRLIVTFPDGEEDAIPITATLISPSFGITP